MSNNIIGRIIDLQYYENIVNKINNGYICLFLRLNNKQSIILKYKIKNYCYVHVNDIDNFIKDIQRMRIKTDYEIIQAKSYNGFNDKQDNFIKLIFTCDSNMKKWLYNIKYNKNIEKYNIKYYETDVDSKLRFIHLTHVNPSGIINISLDDYKFINNTEYFYNHDDLPYLKYESKENIPVLISSFDIECDSNNGNFPQAVKSYSYFFNDVFTWFNKNIFNKNTLQRSIIFKYKNNKELQYKNWCVLLDIILDSDYYKLSIGSSLLKLQDNDEYCEKVRKYMLNKENVNLEENIKKYIDNNVISAINKTLSFTNLRTYEQLVNVSIKILKSKLPIIDIDSLSIKPQDFKKFDMNILDKIFDIGFENNFYWKKCESQVSIYYDKLPHIEGDKIIQIGSVSQWSDSEFPIEKAIFMLDNSKSFNNNDLINLENNDLQKEHDEIFPEKELNIFFEEHKELQKQNTYDENLRIMKEYQLKYQHKHDNANVRINIFTTKLPYYKNIVKIIAHHVNKFKKEQSFNQCCNYVANNKYNTLGNILESLDEYCQIVCDELNNTFHTHIIYNNQTLIQINENIANELADENIIYHYGDEKELLLAWRDYINFINPDIITGYNIFSFDYNYMFDRANVYKLTKFGMMSRIKDFNAKTLTKLTLCSSALGDNLLCFPEVPGRILIDMYKFIQKDYALDSYKLDDVSTLFLYKEKSNVPPQEIFRKQHGSDDDRKDVAMYCILDCILPINLMLKLDVIQKNCAMSNVCKVPINYLFTRGQGIKLFSLVLYYAHNIFKDELLLIDTKQSKEESTGYEGAIVFEPKKGFHTTPTAVGDFNSLYPNSMIARNISHDTIVDNNSPYYQNGKVNYELLKQNGYEYFDISYNDIVKIDSKYIVQNDNENYVTDEGKNIYNNIKFIKDKGWYGSILKTCTFIQTNSYRHGLIPQILNMLLQARKDVRKQIASETNIFHKNVLDTMQLAYKITANSLYGQTGAVTSKIYKKEIAASTTATGRSMVLLARNVFESLAGKSINLPDRFDKNKTTTVYIKSSETRAGDTDSCMTSWLFYKNKEYTEMFDELDSIWYCMNICKYGCDIINNLVPKPEHIEFEKVICPFCIFAKKRYQGYYYLENAFDDPYSPKYIVKNMGSVLKRHDNAHILKYIYSKCLDAIMKERNIDKSFLILENELMNLDKHNINDFVITKTLKSNYKNNNIPHVMLAKKQEIRSPGNSFNINDKVPYVFYYSPLHNNKTLQGDRIETVEFITKNDYKIDYVYYIEKQLLKPLQQIFCELLDQTERFNNIINKAINYYKINNSNNNNISKKTFKINIDKQSDDEIELYTCIFN